MSHKRSSKQPLNMKNGVRGGLDQQKFQARKKIIDGRHPLRGLKWPVSMCVGRYISSAPPITRKQLGLRLLIVIGTATTFGGIGGEFLSETVADYAAGSHVVKDLIDRDCDADPHIAVVTPPNGDPDASANSVLVATVNSIAQRTGQRIGGAKNVVCQQMPRSMRELSLGWR